MPADTRASALLHERDGRDACGGGHPLLTGSSPPTEPSTPRRSSARPRTGSTVDLDDFPAEHWAHLRTTDPFRGPVGADRGGDHRHGTDWEPARGHRYPCQRVVRARSGGPRHCLRSAPHHPGEHSEPEPDLALIQPRDDFYALALPRADEVLLIVEVADTTLRYDREIKNPALCPATPSRRCGSSTWTAGRSRYSRHRRTGAIATSAACGPRARLRPRRCRGSRWICRDSSEGFERRAEYEGAHACQSLPLQKVEI